MHSTLGRASAAVGALVGVVGIVLSTPVSGFIDSVVFWGLVGGLIAAIGLDWADRRSDYR
jgi:hypothetical protein